MSLSALLQPRADTLRLKANRLSILLHDTASPPGLAVCLSGDLDTDSAGDFQSFVFDSLQNMKPQTTLILDLKELTYISSTGVGSLTAALNDSRRRNIKLAICNIPRQVWNIIALRGVAAFLSFLDSYEVCP